MQCLLHLRLQVENPTKTQCCGKKLNFARSNLESVVCPGSKLHVAVLVIKREPGDVYGTGGHEDARGNVGADTFTGHHYIGGICRIKRFTRAAITRLFKNQTFISKTVLCAA